MGVPRYVIGGILGTFPGLGLGHVVQGRWRERGWMMTAGEVGFLLVAANGTFECDFFSEKGDCHGDGSFALGFIGLAAVKIWEEIDVWLSPPMNGRVAFIPPTSKNPAMLALRLEF